jgi:hypothetical protein
MGKAPDLGGAEDVKKYRRGSAGASTALIAVVYADTGTVRNIASQLAAISRESNSIARRPSEAIVHLIPKRNIETWILFLNGQPADEVTDYRHESGLEPLIAPAALQYLALSREGAGKRDECLPSIEASFAEFKRLTAPANAPAAPSS